MMARTGTAMVKDLALGAVGLRSQRSQSHFTARSSMFSTVDTCNQGRVLSLNSDVHRLSGWDNTEGFIRILTTTLFANVFLPLGNRTRRG